MSNNKIIAKIKAIKKEFKLLSQGFQAIMSIHRIMNEVNSLPRTKNFKLMELDTELNTKLNTIFLEYQIDIFGKYKTSNDKYVVQLQHLEQIANDKLVPDNIKTHLAIIHSNIEFVANLKGLNIEDYETRKNTDAISSGALYRIAIIKEWLEELHGERLLKEKNWYME